MIKALSLKNSLTPGRGGVHWGQAGRRWWHLKEAEHLCFSKSSHRVLGHLYGPESRAVQPPVAGDTWALFTLYSRVTVLLYRLIFWHHAIKHLLWRTGWRQNCHWNQSAAIQQTHHPDQQPVIENKNMKWRRNLECTSEIFKTVNVAVKRYVTYLLDQSRPGLFDLLQEFWLIRLVKRFAFKHSPIISQRSELPQQLLVG